MSLVRQSFVADCHWWSVLAVAAVVLLSPAAHANCKDDLQELKPRIDRIKNSDKERHALANKWWGRAAEVEPASESQCHNYQLLARRALTQPKDVNNCSGPNVQSPKCNAQEAEAPVTRKVPPPPPEPPAQMFMAPLR